MASWILKIFGWHSDFDGAFAEYVKVSAKDAFVVDCDWSAEELASIPCAYGTSENMINRAQVKRSDTVLVMGASGGIGVASIQLAKEEALVSSEYVVNRKKKQSWKSAQTE